MTILLTYLIGCILSYGRWHAFFYAIDEKYLKVCPPDKPSVEYVFALISWAGFFVGVIFYIGKDEKYFLKWSRKDLRERHKTMNANLDKAKV